MYEENLHISPLIDVANGYPDFQLPSWAQRISDVYTHAFIDSMPTSECDAAEDIAKRALVMGIGGFEQAAEPDIEGVRLFSNASEALVYSMVGLTNPGDTVIIEEPSLPEYVKNARVSNRVPRAVPPLSSPDSLVALEDEFKKHSPALFVFTNPHNPLGYVLSSETIKTVVALAEQYNVALIGDQVFGPLRYTSDKYSIPPMHPLEHASVDSNIPIVTIYDTRKLISLHGECLAAAVSREDTAQKIDKELKAFFYIRCRCTHY